MTTEQRLREALDKSRHELISILHINLCGNMCQRDLKNRGNALVEIMDKALALPEQPAPVQEGVRTPDQIMKHFEYVYSGSTLKSDDQYCALHCLLKEMWNAAQPAPVTDAPDIQETAERLAKALVNMARHVGVYDEYVDALTKDMVVEIAAALQAERDRVRS